MTAAAYPHLLGVDEANRLRKLALQRVQVLRRAANADARQFVDAACLAALAAFFRGAQQLAGRGRRHVKSRSTTPQVDPANHQLAQGA